MGQRLGDGGRGGQKGRMRHEERMNGRETGRWGSGDGGGGWGG